MPKLNAFINIEYLLDFDLVGYYMLISRTWDVFFAKFLNKPVVMFPNSIRIFYFGSLLG